MGSAQTNASDAVLLGETPQPDGGFRRVRRFPEPLALSRMRGLLLDVAAAGAGLEEGALTGFGEWKFLVTLCDSPWTAGARRDSTAARRVLQRRLRFLGTQPSTIAAAAALSAGSPVHLHGTARPMPPSRVESHIWTTSTMNTDNVRLLVEQGHDFFLVDDTGETACVMAARGHLINVASLAAGDRVSVFGFVDYISDPRAEARSAHARGGLALAVRSGDALPLLVRRA